LVEYRCAERRGCGDLATQHWPLDTFADQHILFVYLPTFINVSASLIIINYLGALAPSFYADIVAIEGARQHHCGLKKGEWVLKSGWVGSWSTRQKGPSNNLHRKGRLRGI
jgi:hypothetical protein